MHGRTNIQIKVDWYTRCCLTVIAALLTLVVVGLWTDVGPRVERQAAAQSSTPPDGFMNPGKQRVGLEEQQKNTNERLSELIRLFQTGNAKVQVTDPKEAGKGQAVNAPAQKQ